ncbi:hypothetical protein [Salinibacter ruber]|uniref:hypothetical protein n=1 Tax=Salinibacter ruber TaxID=146919 RepID=UPI00216784B9|nr:hypothetical protein [Salinibacter ruber]MCS4142545.1 FkbM family methyltransferase [Salinibacter ruber]
MRYLRLLALLLKHVTGRSIRQIDNFVEWEGMYQDVLRKELFLKKIQGALYSNSSPRVNIVQVGANDGKTNDPIYDFIRENKENTNIILVGPTKQVIPYLRGNYSFHGTAEIVNKAIGLDNESSLELYGLKEEYWEYVSDQYNKDWPDYRAPTGIVSSDREYVRKWISENVTLEKSEDDMLKTFRVGSVSPKQILRQSNIMDSVDILQVDVEGMDDSVVYSFFRNSLYPSIINIEKNHLSNEREEKYDMRLKDNDYQLFDYSDREKLGIMI